MVGHVSTLEYGGGETGKEFQRACDTKVLRETTLKLPKALKDMLDALAATNPSKLRDLETIGVGTYGTFLLTYRMLKALILIVSFLFYFYQA